jgi:hypothetical protein
MQDAVAMTTPAWTRLQWKPHLTRMLPVAAVASCGIAFATGLVAGGATGSTTTLTVPVVTPVHVTLPPPPAPVVVPPAPAPPPPVKPRATQPHLMTMCLFPRTDTTAGNLDQACEWDDGFPAISVDGKLIATRGGVDDPGRGNPSDGLQLIDASSGRTLREITLLGPDEYTTDEAPLAKLQVTVGKRVAAAQRMLDERGFRSLRALGAHRAGSDPDATEVQTGIYAQFAGELVRIVDSSTATELGRHSFAVPEPSRASADDSSMPCSSQHLNRLDVWWDPGTRIVLGLSEYRTGGDSCPDVTISQTFQLPAR